MCQIFHRLESGHTINLPEGQKPTICSNISKIWVLNKVKMTRLQTTPQRVQRLPQVEKTLPNAYLCVIKMTNFVQKTHKSGLIWDDNPPKLSLKLSGVFRTNQLVFFVTENLTTEAIFHQNSLENVLVLVAVAG